MYIKIEYMNAFRLGYLIIESDQIKHKKSLDFHQSFYMLVLTVGFHYRTTLLIAITVPHMAEYHNMSPTVNITLDALFPKLTS